MKPKNKPSKAALERQQAKELRLNKMLSNAIDKEDLLQIRFLVNQGANVNADIPDERSTLLNQAVETDNVEVVRELLRLGADANAGGQNQFTPLYLCINNAYRNCYNMTLALLEAGANPNLKYDDCPPLFRVEKWKQNCAKLLLEHGAEVQEVVPEVKANILDYWAEDGLWECLAYWIVFNHPELNDELEPLLVPVRDEEARIYETEGRYISDPLPEHLTLPLLKFCFHHADFDNPEGWEKYMLLGATHKHELEGTQFLLDSGKFDINLSMSYSPYTALHNSCSNIRFAPIVIRLLKMGADPNIVSGFGNTPIGATFHFKDNPDVIAAFLDAGYDANSLIDNEPFLFAPVRQCRNKELKLLMQRGYSPNAHNDSECSLLQTAGTMIWDMRDKHLKQNLELQNRVLETVKILVEAGADINYVSRSNFSSKLDEAAKELYYNRYFYAAEYLCSLPQANPKWVNEVTMLLASWKNEDGSFNIPLESEFGNKKMWQKLV